MTIALQATAAKKFAEKWKGKGYEKGETQKFWFELLHTVYGVDNPADNVECEVPVMLEHISFIDIYLPRTKVMIEQKSLGKDLSKPIKQSDGTLLTPMQQLKRYAAALGYFKYPRWGITCNFAEFYIYDMGNPNSEPEIIKLEDLPKEYYRLNFLVDMSHDNIMKELDVSLNAGKITGKLYEALLKQYGDKPTAKMLKSLNLLIVRLVFCMYAEDSGIFGKKNMFTDYLKEVMPVHFRKVLIELFKILDTPTEERDPYEEKKLLEFPYVNGGLFSDENIIVPSFDQECIDIIIKACDFDWSEISPTIFGAIFESTIADQARRSGGMHYTSLENIHKVIDPLFLNDLKAEYEEIIDSKDKSKIKSKLRFFQDKLASLTFFDPACGSGNFLTETYISLRRLENQVIEKLFGQEIILGDLANPVKVSIQQFYGIEINDYACVVAKTALWIAELQMMQETQALVHMNLDILPLKSYANIVEGNALRLDWNDIISKDKLNYIMGNPPFVGNAHLTDDQKKDRETLFSNRGGDLDYVACWYKKAANYIIGENIKCAFVSTNSICQGQQVPPLWKELLENGVSINFAYKTFKWNSETTMMAHVNCVIIGFSMNKGKHCIIYNGAQSNEVDNINGYLLGAPNIYIEKRRRPLQRGIPIVIKGFQPTDNGYLLLTADEKRSVEKSEPEIIKWIRPFISAKEYIYGKERWCLWLKGITPAQIKTSPFLRERIMLCQEWRSNQKQTGDAYKLRNVPFLMRPNSNFIENVPFIILPRHSGEKRKYIPFGFSNSNDIPGDSVSIVINAGIYHFGILNSNVHMAWMRAVCGRLEMRYRYASDIVYNNFPWPTPTESQKAKIETTAQAILDARAKYPDSCLAVLYDEAYMPLELRKAHQANDRAVMEAYGFWGKFTSKDKAENEAACVAELMKMYQKMIEN